MIWFIVNHVPDELFKKTVLFDRNTLTLQVFIVSFEGLEVLQSFLVRVLYFEELGAEGSRLLLCPIQLSLTLLILLLPLRQNLRKAQITGLNKDVWFYEGYQMLADVSLLVIDDVYHC